MEMQPPDEMMNDSQKTNGTYVDDDGTIVVVAKPLPRLVKHKVRPGETVSGLIEGSGYSIKEISDLNNLSDSNRIYPGQVIKVPEAATGTVLKLSPSEMKFAQQFLDNEGMPSEHLDDVVFIKGMQGHGLVVEAALMNDNPAITRGNKIYVRDDFWEKAIDPEQQTFWSEIYHTSQYQLGYFGLKYSRDVAISVATTFDTRANNDIEVIAHERGQKMADSWTEQQRKRK